MKKMRTVLCLWVALCSVPAGAACYYGEPVRVCLDDLGRDIGDLRQAEENAAADRAAAEDRAAVQRSVAETEGILRAAQAERDAHAREFMRDFEH